MQTAKDAESTKKTADKKLELAVDQERKSLEKLKEAQELLDTMLSLLIAVTEKVIPIVENSDALIDTLSKNIAKADKMYSQILDVEKAANIDKQLNKERAEELDKKEIWIKDRVEMLGRSEKELKE